MWKISIFIQIFFMKRFLLIYGVALLYALSLSAQTQIINPTIEGGFELPGGFSGNGWTVVNSNKNTWHSSSVAGAFTGNNSAFISPDGGLSYGYDTAKLQTSHFYRLVTVPANQSNIQLKFQCKSVGEPFFDRLLVYTAPQNLIPVLGKMITALLI